MKPLELTVYPKMGSVYYDDEANCTWSETMVYGLSVEKRLTDAELAAEYWRLRLKVCSRGNRDMKAVGHVCVNWQEAHDELDVMQRFLELPSYDEVSL